ncbi:GMP synthase-like glutamine amidotransferase [Palleronia aestuarii]|uniref:GMP synthase-like glutamine amidotransferase n=1 Tax=Palleronia aestuarii TaxID=568105 RepID=A0A2W7NDR4_9RHOB|nr:type 1 glutamine amidotransferase [Palleronia aestuarii]PZX18298.1 GMP synthase-like glutamine amidotransferase [Palleronia aestuarii]
MHLGLLQCGATPEALDPVHGSYPALYGRLLGTGFEWTTWRVFDDEWPDGPGDAEGWLVSGSRHGAYEDHAWIAPLEALLRDIAASGRPLVGICFGHQIVAQALGGRVEKFGGGWSIGRRAYEIDGETWHLNAWHQDQVVVPPSGARTFAANDFTLHAGLAIGENILTLQPHPEFSPDYIADMIASREGGKEPQHLLDAARDALPLEVDNGRMGRRLAEFFREKARDAKEDA